MLFYFVVFTMSLCLVCNLSKKGEQLVVCVECQETVHQKCAMTPCEEENDPDSPDYGVFFCSSCRKPEEEEEEEEEEITPSFIKKKKTPLISKSASEKKRPRKNLNYNENKRR